MGLGLGLAAEGLVILGESGEHAAAELVDQLRHLPSGLALELGFGIRVGATDRSAQVYHRCTTGVPQVYHRSYLGLIVGDVVSEALAAILDRVALGLPRRRTLRERGGKVTVTVTVTVTVMATVSATVEAGIQIRAPCW